MIAPTQIRKPENWQDFEKLCKKLWGEIWGCSDTIQRNGRWGQRQNGVDIYGLPKGKNTYYGIQCKQKDEKSDSSLCIKEIEDEINKAKSFEPPLGRLIIATTANKNAKIEEHIRKKNIEHIKNEIFEVCVSFWEDIVDLLEENPNTYKWYLNNCQYKDTSDVMVTFDYDEDCIEIFPKYIKTITKTKLKLPLTQLDLNSDFSKLNDFINSQISNDEFHIPLYNLNPAYAPYDCRLCKIEIFVENIGNTTLDDCSLSVSWNCHLIRDFTSEEMINVDYYKDGIRVGFKHPIVQKDIVSASISLMPQDGVEKIELSWQFLSRNYNKKGKLFIKVSPIYEEQIKYKEVENESEMKEDEILVAPKIICVRR